MSDDLSIINPYIYIYIYGIDKSVNSLRIIDVANCITAREDRGVSNRKAEGTAVIEIYRSEYDN